jgi:hypothetical protein
MAEWQSMDVAHSSKVVTGRRVPFWSRPDWRSLLR